MLVVVRVTQAQIVRHVGEPESRAGLAAVYAGVAIVLVARAGLLVLSSALAAVGFACGLLHEPLMNLGREGFRAALGEDSDG